MKFCDYLLCESNADAFWLCRSEVEYSGKTRYGYVVWRVQDFLNAYDFAKGKNIDSVTNSINRKCKGDGDPFYRVYAEVKGVAEPEQIKLYRDLEDANLALSRVCPKAAALLGKKGVTQIGESKNLNEGNEYYLLILTKYSTDLKKNLKQYLVWTKKDLQTYEPKAYGSTMGAAIATFNKVREDREEEEYIESLGAIDCDKRYAGKVCDTLAKAKADIMKISPEVKKALESGLTEGEFIPIKDWEAKQKKLNPAKEAKLKTALAKVDAAREKVNKFMKTYDAKSEESRTERAKLGAELAAAMSAYLEIL